MKPKKQTQKTSQQKPAVNAAPVDNKQQETASPKIDNKSPETVTPPVATPEPVTPPPAASTPVVSTEKPKDEKPKAPSISTVVRKLVIENPDKTVDEISSLLIATGWDASDVEKRKSTIITLRTDALGILKIAKECGWEKK
jgi:hypothetical protein